MRCVQEYRPEGRITDKMQIRFFNESDGKCFADSDFGCMALKDEHPKCGTYGCPLYKPEDCKEWVRLDTRNMARIFAPEEVDYGY